MLRVWVRVPEMEVWTKFNRETKAFVDYLQPGRHWIMPWERIGDKLSTQAKVVGGKCLQTQTDDGITPQVDWSVTYKLEPTQIADYLRSPLARTLPQYSDRMVRSHGNNCTARVISELPVTALTDNGSRRRLERMIREELVERLHPFGIQVFRVMVTGVKLPEKVAETYEAAHERIVYAISEAEAMGRLHEAVSKFTDADMERLLLLKQLRELGQNGVAMYMQPIMPIIQNGRANGEAAGDGRTPPKSPPKSGHADWQPPAN